jgi:hypothetical protein
MVVSSTLPHCVAHQIDPNHIGWDSVVDIFQHVLVHTYKNKTTKEQNNKRTKENIQNTFNGMP